MVDLSINQSINFNVIAHVTEQRKRPVTFRPRNIKDSVGRQDGETVRRSFDKKHAAFFRK